MIKLFEMLLGINFTDKTLPQFYLDYAYQMILNYTKLNELSDKYNNSIIMLAVYLYKNKDNLNIKTIREGNRSITYNDNSNNIPNEVLATLPYPRMKVM